MKIYDFVVVDENGSVLGVMEDDDPDRSYISYTLVDDAIGAAMDHIKSGHATVTYIHQLIPTNLVIRKSKDNAKSNQPYIAPLSTKTPINTEKNGPSAFPDLNTGKNEWEDDWDNEICDCEECRNDRKFDGV